MITTMLLFLQFVHKLKSKGNVIILWVHVGKSV